MPSRKTSQWQLISVVFTMFLLNNLIKSAISESKLRNSVFCAFSSFRCSGPTKLKKQKLLPESERPQLPYFFGKTAIPKLCPLLAMLKLSAG